MHNKELRHAHKAEYQAWVNMKARCTNATHPAYPEYGGRGIRVDDQWRASFADFLAEIGVRPSGKHSLDRINNGGNYEPGNVRWATAKEQAMNRRQPRTKHLGKYAAVIDLRDKGMSFAAISRALGLSRQLAARIFKGSTRHGVGAA